MLRQDASLTQSMPVPQVRRSLEDRGTLLERARLGVKMGQRPQPMPRQIKAASLDHRRFHGIKAQDRTSVDVKWCKPMMSDGFSVVFLRLVILDAPKIGRCEP